MKRTAKIVHWWFDCDQQCSTRMEMCFIFADFRSPTKNQKPFSASFHLRFGRVMNRTTNASSILVPRTQTTTDNKKKNHLAIIVDADTVRFEEKHATTTAVANEFEFQASDGIQSFCFPCTNCHPKTYNSVVEFLGLSRSGILIRNSRLY